jgi:Cu/Ag efflux protein CusF
MKGERLMKKLGWLALFGFAGALAVAGCSQMAPVKEYDVQGQVVSVDRARNTITIHHDDIPGFAGVTDTQFEVHDAQLLNGLQAGDEVRGRLHVKGGNAVLASLEKLSSNRNTLVEKNRARLSPEDRALVEAQELCPIQKDQRLGSMGKPVKVMIKGQPVFLCCGSCEEEARANPDRTLAQAEELKRRAAARRGPTEQPSGLSAVAEKNRAKLSPPDRKLADAQDRCPITDKSLGSMGKPLKVMIKGQPVFLCCSGCEDEALAQTDKTLAKVEELKKQVARAAGKK